MKLILALILFGSFQAYAHEHGEHADQEIMVSEKALPGASLFQLENMWTDAKGVAKPLKSLIGQPRLVTMLYTRCQTSCPLIVDEIQRILNTLPDRGAKFQVSLFSFDSELETPETMQAFTKKRSLGTNWTVYKSDKDGVENLAAVLNIRYKKLKNGEYIHSNSIFLVDEKGVIITQKDGLNSKDEAFMKAVKQMAKKGAI